VSQEGHGVPDWLIERDGQLLLRIKAVPGARRDAIVGPLGDHLKIAVAAPPEKGKANRRIEALLASALAIPAAHVAVIQGRSAPRKVVKVSGVTATDAAARLEPEDRGR